MDFITLIGPLLATPFCYNPLANHENLESMPGHDVSGWLSFDPSTLTAKIVAVPTVDQVPFDVNMNLIVEFYR